MIRSANARFAEVPLISPETAQKRVVGAVTIDNQDYLRYMGKSKFVSESCPQMTKSMSLRK